MGLHGTDAGTSWETGLCSRLQAENESLFAEFGLSLRLICAMLREQKKNKVLAFLFDLIYLGNRGKNYAPLLWHNI